MPARPALAKLRAVTWDELATRYAHAHRGARPARTLPMETLFAWAARQTDTFCVGADGTLYVRRTAPGAPVDPDA